MYVGFGVVMIEYTCTCIMVLMIEKLNLHYYIIICRILATVNVIDTCMVCVFVLINAIISIINCAIWPKERTVQCQIRSEAPLANGVPYEHQKLLIYMYDVKQYPRNPSLSGYINYM